MEFQEPIMILRYHLAYVMYIFFVLYLMYIYFALLLFCEFARGTGGGAKGQSGYHSIWGSEVLYHYHVPSNQRNYSDQRYKKVFHFLL